MYQLNKFVLANYKTRYSFLGAEEKIKEDNENLNKMVTKMHKQSIQPSFALAEFVTCWGKVGCF
jgi:hypothetical protein